MSSPSTFVHIAPVPRRRWFQSPKVLRHAVMAFFFLFLLHVAYDHQVKGGGPNGAPSVEAYCPFGGLESLYQFLTTGGFVRRIEPSALIMFAALVLLTLVASRGFCGWICPFGSVQEWLGLAGRKILKKKFNPSGAWDRALRYLKYGILAAIIALTWHTGALVFRDYDPFLAFFHLGQHVEELPWAYSILGIVLAGSLGIERFFCKYACPLGAVLGILGRFGLTRIERDPAGCKSCNLCQKKCHAHVDFLSRTAIRDAECNLCMDCVMDCPKPAVLSVRGPRWRFSHPVYAAMLVAGLFGLIGASQLAGKWQTQPAMVSFKNRDGKLDPEAIRGWMTLEQISQGYGIPLERIYQAAGIPKHVPAGAHLNRVASDFNVKFHPDKMRDVVRSLAGGTPTASARQEPKPGRGGGDSERVRGFMTLNEISLETGVPADFLLKQLGLASAGIDPRVPVRGWVHAHGKSIQDVRDAVSRWRK